MKRIMILELMAFAKGVEGQVLKTIHRGKEFRVVVTEDSLVYIPESSGTKTKNDRGCVEKICEEFSKTNNYSPKHYEIVLRAWHASYTLTLIKMCLANKQ